MTIKAVFFDIDGTLFPSKRFAAFARRNAVRAMLREGLRLSEEEVYSSLMRVVERYGSNYPFHFNKLLISLGFREDPRLLAAAIRAYHDSKLRMKPYPGTKEVLRRLKRMGLDIYAASRGIPVKQWDKLMRLGLHRFFSGVFVSRKTKDAAFYRRLLKALKLAPGEAVMVGDKEDEDILPALKAGLHCILIAREGSAKRGGFYVVRSISKVPEIIRSLQEVGA